MHIVFALQEQQPPPEIRWYLRALDWWDSWLTTVLAIAGAVILDLLARNALQRLEARGVLPAAQSRLVQRIVRVLLVVLAVLIAAPPWGVRISNLWTVLSAVLAVVGVGFFAAWSYLSNVLASFIILVWRPFSIGDHVEILPNGPAGKVLDINLMYCVLEAADGARVAVPNSHFLQHAVRCQRPGA